MIGIVGFMKEFMDYMKEQKIISVALAFIVGIATAALVQSLVKDIITPMYGPYLNFLNPETAIEVGASKFMVGSFMTQVVNWIIILLVVFVIGKKLVGEPKK